jgi:hypothetical protein
MRPPTLWLVNSAGPLDALADRGCNEYFSSPPISAGTAHVTATSEMYAASVEAGFPGADHRRQYGDVSRETRDI